MHRVVQTASGHRPGRLFFSAVFGAVVLAGFFSVVDCMEVMTMSDVRMVAGLLVVPCFVMLCGGQMVMGSLLVMLGSLLAVLCALMRGRRHEELRLLVVLEGEERAFSVELP